jgi:hypothetical protein
MDRNGTFTPQIVAPHQRRFSPKPLLPGRHLRHRQPALTTECHYTLPHCSCSDTSPLNFAAFCSMLSPIKTDTNTPISQDAVHLPLTKGVDYLRSGTADAGAGG